MGWSACSMGCCASSMGWGGLWVPAPCSAPRIMREPSMRVTVPDTSPSSSSVHMVSRSSGWPVHVPQEIGRVAQRTAAIGDLRLIFPCCVVQLCQQQHQQALPQAWCLWGKRHRAEGMDEGLLRLES
ncbi:hypothetical protein E2C01_010274 [Portunus trituberculatus]|uniref:Secreted protein n=1 Tax=Portunus trituberculatus TaxID=210409 RepID=A0A5B7D7Y2_PORTR|nr:hypothetical protein [Portunus trituberculatus]